MVDYICPKEAIFLFEMLKSIEIISHSSEKKNVLTTLQGIFSLTNKIKPPQTYSNLCETSYTHLYEIVNLEKNRLILSPELNRNLFPKEQAP